MIRSRKIDKEFTNFKSMTPPFRTGLEKGNNSISAFIPTLPGGAFKGGGFFANTNIKGLKKLALYNTLAEENKKVF